MTAITLQKELIKKISEIKDNKRLISIKEYIEMECEIYHPNGAVQLTPEMVQLLEKSEAQYQKGEYTSHEQFMTEMDIWLRERA
jgi:hypothetical protein